MSSLRKCFLGFFVLALMPLASFAQEEVTEVDSVELSLPDEIPTLETVQNFDQSFDVEESILAGHPWDESLGLTLTSLRESAVPDPEVLEEFVGRYTYAVDGALQAAKRKGLFRSIEVAYEHHFGMEGKDDFLKAVTSEASNARNEPQRDPQVQGQDSIYESVQKVFDSVNRGVNSEDFLSDVRKVYEQGFEKWAVQEFLNEIEKGIYDFKESGIARIKFVNVGSKKEPVLIAKVVVSGKKASILVLNLKLSLNRKRINDSHTRTQKYRKRLMWKYKTNVLITSLDDAGHMIPMSYYIHKKNIFTFLPRYVDQAYENPTVNSVAVALFSTSLQLSILVGGFWVDANYLRHLNDPSLLGAIQNNLPALLVGGSYGLFCSSFSDFYDRLIRHPIPIIETLIKTGYVLPANYAIMALTKGWANPTAIIFAPVLSMGEKLASTYMIRKIRIQQEEGLLQDHYEIRLSGLIHWIGNNPDDLVHKRYPDLKLENLSRLERAQYLREAIEMQRGLQILQKRGLLKNLMKLVWFRAPKVISWREIFGGVRQILKVGAFTFDQHSGVPLFSSLTYVVAFVSHRSAQKMVRDTRDDFQRHGQVRRAKIFNGHDLKLQDEAWLVPGLRRLVMEKILRRPPRQIGCDRQLGKLTTKLAE